MVKVGPTITTGRHRNDIEATLSPNKQTYFVNFICPKAYGK